MSKLDKLDRALREPEPLSPHAPAGKTAIGRQTASALGIANAAILPSLGLHGGLSLITYGLARATNRVQLKDYLWPTGMVLNAWWTAVGRHVFMTPHHSVGTALNGLGYYQKVLLGAVTAWGGRLAYRIVTRSLRRKEGGDDPRYGQAKQEPGFWNKRGLMVFGIEAVFQSLITLPFTTTFRNDQIAGLTGDLSVSIRWLAAGLFTAGLTLESLSDYQVDAHKRQEAGHLAQNADLYTAGVWSIVRHPNYLGDALCHLSFPLWCYGSGMFTPLQVLGPVANYVFLRYVGGDRYAIASLILTRMALLTYIGSENEASQSERYSRESPKKHAQLQEWREQKHSFWPGVKELGNPWTLVIIGAGALGALVQAYVEGKVTGGAEGARGIAEGGRAAYVAYT
ncbi:hypothetical protein LTR85_008267 [Meristemomyces frigidus]|nr:hypothetical protein LTR85_008267 [Meristemomyces frigidus]